MRFSVSLLAALVVSVNGVALTHKPVVPVTNMILLDTTSQVKGSGLDGNGDMSDQYNMTPYVRQMSNGMWEGGVPNYEDPAAPMWTRQFSAEGEAKAWAYSKTGAAQDIRYEMADGADGDEDMIDQIVKEGRQANNSNFKKNEHNENAEGGTAGGLEKPIIDATGGAHLGQTVYHTSAAHSTRQTEDNKKLAEEAAARAAFQKKHGKRSVFGGNSGEDKTITKETRAALQAAKKAKKNAIWTKAASIRNQKNGGNDRLTKAQKAKTQGARDSKDKRAAKLNTLGAGKHKIANSAGNARRAADQA